MGLEGIESENLTYCKLSHLTEIYSMLLEGAPINVGSLNSKHIKITDSSLINLITDNVREYRNRLLDELEHSSDTISRCGYLNMYKTPHGIATSDIFPTEQSAKCHIEESTGKKYFTTVPTMYDYAHDSDTFKENNNKIKV